MLVMIVHARVLSTGYSSSTHTCDLKAVLKVKISCRPVGSRKTYLYNKFPLLHLIPT